MAGNNKLTTNNSNEQKPPRSVPEQQSLPKPAASPQKTSNRFASRTKREEIKPEIIPQDTRRESTPTKASSDSGVDSLVSDPLQNSLKREVLVVSVNLESLRKIVEKLLYKV